MVHNGDDFPTKTPGLSAYVDVESNGVNQVEYSVGGTGDFDVLAEGTPITVPYHMLTPVDLRITVTDESNPDHYITNTIENAFHIGECTLSADLHAADSSNGEYISTVGNVRSTFQPGGYENYIDGDSLYYSSAFAIPGNYAEFILARGSGSNEVHFWSVWVDWNRDCDFNDAGEFVFTKASDAEFINARFLIYSEQDYGRYAMRVAMSPDGYQLDPNAGEFDRGEVEDHGLLIRRPIPVNPIPWAECGILTQLDWDLPIDKPQFDIWETCQPGLEGVCVPGKFTFETGRRACIDSTGKVDSDIMVRFDWLTGSPILPGQIDLKGDQWGLDALINIDNVSKKEEEIWFDCQ